MSVVWDELFPFEFLDFVMFELGKWDLLHRFQFDPSYNEYNSLYGLLSLSL